MLKTELKQIINKVLVSRGYKVSFIKQHLKDYVDIIVIDDLNHPVGYYSICYETEEIEIYDGKILGCISAFIRVYSLIDLRKVS